MFDRGSDQTLYLVGPADIDRMRDDGIGMSGRGDVRGFFNALRLDVGRYHPGAFLCKAEHAGAPDAAGRSCDDGYLVLESHEVLLLLCGKAEYFR